MHFEHYRDDRVSTASIFSQFILNETISLKKITYSNPEFKLKTKKLFHTLYFSAFKCPLFEVWNENYFSYNLFNKLQISPPPLKNFWMAECKPAAKNIAWILENITILKS